MRAPWYKALALGAALALSGVALAGARAGENGISSTDFDALNGARDIYQENCAACHGYDGVPMVAGAANFSVGERLDKSDAELLGIIRNGKDNMPPWEDMLSGRDQATALFYVRQLVGDILFVDNCAACHADSLPPFAAGVPADEALADAAGAADGFEICGGSDVESALDPGQLADLVRFVRRLAGRAAE